jgi:hypothetical protein
MKEIFLHEKIDRIIEERIDPSIYDKDLSMFDLVEGISDIGNVINDIIKDTRKTARKAVRGYKKGKEVLENRELGLIMANYLDFIDEVGGDIDEAQTVVDTLYVLAAKFRTKGMSIDRINAAIEKILDSLGRKTKLSPKIEKMAKGSNKKRDTVIKTDDLIRLVLSYPIDKRIEVLGKLKKALSQTPVFESQFFVGDLSENLEFEKIMIESNVGVEPVLIQTSKDYYDILTEEVEVLSDGELKAVLTQAIEVALHNDLKIFTDKAKKYVNNVKENVGSILKTKIRELVKNKPNEISLDKFNQSTEILLKNMINGLGPDHDGIKIAEKMIEFVKNEPKWTGFVVAVFSAVNKFVSTPKSGKIIKKALDLTHKLMNSEAR